MVVEFEFVELEDTLLIIVEEAFEARAGVAKIRGVSNEINKSFFID